MAIEFELKYSADVQAQEAILAAYPGGYHTYEMETTYYDAPNGGLSQRHITLRRRFENGRSVCTVKTPVSGFGRGEWECECDDIAVAVVRLVELGASRELLLLTAQGVKPICGAKFTRRALSLKYRGAELELALDRGVLLGGGKEIPLCEVEVELKSGEPEKAVAFAEDMAKKFGLRPEKRSKFRRALALAKGE
jgi:inorganic triphosphatase YgiF